MITVGEILATGREKKKLTLEQVEKSTRIRSKFLVALEKNQFEKLPPGTFTKGLIKNYASFLGLAPEETLAFYRRQVNEEKPVVNMPNEQKSNSRRLPFSLSFASITTGVLVLLFFVYLGFSYLKFAGAPNLNLTSPSKNAVVQTDQIDVTGKTDPNVTVTINNQEIAVNENGSFQTKITLQPGLNTITVVAVNKFNRQSTIVRNLRLEK